MRRSRGFNAPWCSRPTTPRCACRPGASTLEACGSDEAALAEIAKARTLAPQWERLRWAEALLLPRIARDEEQIARTLARFDEGLGKIERGLRMGDDEARAAALDAASTTSPFNLFYLPGDHTSRQFRYGDLVAEVARACMPEFTAPLPRRQRDGRIRVETSSAATW